jgi:hypothetical protein
LHNKPRPYRYITDMPERASTALVRCHSDVVLVGKHEEKGITTRTLNVLVTRELISEGRDKRARRAWKPTEHGITLLTTEVPRLLAARSHKGYTTIPALALSNEPEAVDERTLNRFAEVNNTRHAVIKAGGDQELFTQHRSLEHRLHMLKRVALERGIDTRSEMRIVERGLDALERKIRGQRAA